MQDHDRLSSDGAILALLDGSSVEEGAAPLGPYLVALRADAETTAPSPSAELVHLLEVGPPAPMTGVSPARRGNMSWRARGRLVVQAAATQFAALGLLGKVAVAGAAVSVAASGAGAAGVLPDDAQQAFDRVVGRTIEAPSEVPEDSGPATSEADDVPVEQDPTSSEDTTEPPAETPVPPAQQGAVSDDARGEDGERGVDGGAVARDASDGRSDQGQRPADAGKPANGSQGSSPGGPPADAPGSRPDGAGQEQGQGKDKDKAAEHAPPARGGSAERGQASDAADDAVGPDGTAVVPGGPTTPRG